jgi:hypothetical protein
MCIHILEFSRRFILPGADLAVWVPMGDAKYHLRYFFDWSGGCLWPGNDLATRDFGAGPLDVATCPLPLSARTVERCRQLSEWHDTSLNWDYPPDPGPWRKTECDRFNNEATKLLADIRRELGASFHVLNEHVDCFEDPDLDRYLADPGRFRRT